MKNDGEIDVGQAVAIATLLYLLIVLVNLVV